MDTQASSLASRGRRGKAKRRLCRIQRSPGQQPQQEMKCGVAHKTKRSRGIPLADPESPSRDIIARDALASQRLFRGRWSCADTDIQGERLEAAAADARFVSERNGGFPFARPCGFGVCFALAITLKMKSVFPTV